MESASGVPKAAPAASGVELTVEKYLGITLRDFASNLVTSNVAESTRSDAETFIDRMAPEPDMPVIPLPDGIVDTASSSGTHQGPSGATSLWVYEVASDASLSQLRQVYEQDAGEAGWSVATNPIDPTELDVAATWGLQQHGTVVLVLADAAPHAGVSVLRVLFVTG